MHRRDINSGSPCAGPCCSPHPSLPHRCLLGWSLAACFPLSLLLFLRFRWSKCPAGPHTHFATVVLLCLPACLTTRDARYDELVDRQAAQRARPARLHARRGRRGARTRGARRRLERVARRSRDIAGGHLDIGVEHPQVRQPTHVRAQPRRGVPRLAALLRLPAGCVWRARLVLARADGGYAAIGSLMNAKWVNEKGVTFMPFCQAQGAIKQLADVGTAIWAFVIAMHTFWVLFLGWDLRRYVLITTIVFNWSAIAAFVIAGPATLNVKQHGPFYGISGYWCWISDQYPGARIALDYMFMFASAFLSFVLYSLIFLKIRGNILVAGWRWRFRVHHSTDSARGLSADDQSVAVAKQMLLYPVAYTCIILPIAIARFADWAGAEVPFAATVFTDCVYLLSGLINVSLFFLTRRVLPRHSIITKRFTDDPEPDDSFEAGGRSPVGDVPGSYMAEKMDDTFFEDDASEHEKVFKQVGSPDSEPVPDDDEVPPITIVTDVHDAEDPHTPHGQRHAHRPIESGAGHPHSPMEDEPVIAPDSAIASSPGSFSAVSLDSAYTSSARRADFPASSGGPIAYPQSPLAVPGQNIPKTPLSPMARSPSRSEALRSNLGL